MKKMRLIIRIDEEKCDGCGACIPSCAEGALQIVDGKARMVEDRLCDGLGNCLGECPRGAIEIIEREAEQFDEAAVERHLQSLKNEEPAPCHGCAGSAERILWDEEKSRRETEGPAERGDDEDEAELSHWPIQLHLVSPRARFLQEPELLIAADCVPFAYANFHKDFLKEKSLIICCPKLDDTSVYRAKLTEIFKLQGQNIEKITLAYMEVPCCYGLSQLVKTALEKARVEIPVVERIVGVDGSLK